MARKNIVEFIFHFSYRKVLEKNVKDDLTVMLSMQIVTSRLAALQLVVHTIETNDK
jgi:hypothetical protein